MLVSGISFLIFGIFFLIAGGVFFAGKGHEHFKEWQKMSDEEKARVRIEPLCRNIGLMIGLCGVIFVVCGLWSDFRIHGFIWAMLVWFVIGFADVYFIGKSSRYKVE